MFRNTNSEIIISDLLLNQSEKIANFWTQDVITQLEVSISSVESIIMVISLSLVTLITIIGNTMVIISIFNYKPLKNVQNMFLVNLAIADISVAIVVMPFSIVDMLLDRWVFGTFLCELWLTSDVLLCTASILNLCTIALDRYWAIYDPINYAQRRTIKQVLLKIACVWILSAMISIPPLFGLNDWPEEFAGDTPCKYSEHVGYVFYSATGSFYLPLLIMSVVYYKIYHATSKRLRGRVKAPSTNLKGNESSLDGNDKNPEAKHHGVENRANMIESGDPDHGAVSLNYTQDSSSVTVAASTRVKTGLSSPYSAHKKTISHNTQTTLTCGLVNKERSTMDNLSRIGDHKFSSTASSLEKDPKMNSENVVQRFWEEKQKISLSKERRAARILGVVMGIFTVCWLPFFIMYLIIPFYPYIPWEMRAFITWLGYVNSALNPVIYTIFNVDFRRAFQRQLCCKDSN